MGSGNAAKIIFRVIYCCLYMIKILQVIVVAVPRSDWQLTQCCVELTSTVSLLRDVEKHISKYPSKVVDSGTHERFKIHSWPGRWTPSLLPQSTGVRFYSTAYKRANDWSFVRYHESTTNVAYLSLSAKRPHNHINTAESMLLKSLMTMWTSLWTNALKLALYL